jgi:hypothetical protein
VALVSCQTGLVRHGATLGRGRKRGPSSSGTARNIKPPVSVLSTYSTVRYGCTVHADASHNQSVGSSIPVFSKDLSLCMELVKGRVALLCKPSNYRHVTKSEKALQFSSTSRAADIAGVWVLAVVSNEAQTAQRNLKKQVERIQTRNEPIQAKPHE